MAKSKTAQETYQAARDAFRTKPSAASKKKFLEARQTYIVQRQKDNAPTPIEVVKKPAKAKPSGKKPTAKN